MAREGETMKYQFTFRHVDISQSLTSYAEEQFERISRHLLKDCRWQVFFSMGRYDCQVDVSVNSPWGHFKATSRCADFYEAVDEAAHKLERQFQKKKEQNQHHRKPELSRIGRLEDVNEALEYHPVPERKLA
jgi:putative sigma-54 modulation protein